MFDVSSCLIGFGNTKLIQQNLMPFGSKMGNDIFTFFKVIQVWDDAKRLYPWLWVYKRFTMTGGKHARGLSRLSLPE